jgi:hypothetical protein
LRYSIMRPDGKVNVSFIPTVPIKEIYSVQQDLNSILVFGSASSLNQTDNTRILAIYDLDGTEKKRYTIPQYATAFVPYCFRKTADSYIYAGSAVSSVGQTKSAFYSYEKADMEWYSFPLEGNTYKNYRVETRNPSVILGMHTRPDGNWDILSATKMFNDINAYSVKKISPDGQLVY